MTAFLYYARNDQTKTATATREEIVALGLGHVFDDYTIGRGVSHGPDATQGHVFCLDSSASHFKFAADKQTWSQMGKDGPWLGYWNDAKPTPVELARDHQIDGEWMRFEDGNLWHIPFARQFVVEDGEIWSSCKLPQRFTLNDDGEWITGGIKPRYQQLWDLIEGYESAIANGDTTGGMVSFIFEPINELAVVGVQANYRVSKYELDALGVFDGETRDRIIDVLRDNKTWLSWAQKKIESAARAGGSLSDGPDESTPDSTADTDQQLPTGKRMNGDSIEEPETVEAVA